MTPRKLFSPASNTNIFQSVRSNFPKFSPHTLIHMNNKIPWFYFQKTLIYIIMLWNDSFEVLLVWKCVRTTPPQYISSRITPSPWCFTKFTNSCDPNVTTHGGIYPGTDTRTGAILAYHRYLVKWVSLHFFYHRFTSSPALQCWIII